MQDWIVIGIIALLSAAVGFWALRRKPADAVAEPGSRSAELPKAGIESGVDSRRALAMPAETPLAVLMFECAPGRVAVIRSEVVIGRHSEDDIRVPDVRVSRHHARLVAKRSGGFEIHNLTAVRSEPNPMLVNGVAREHAAITDGDVVSLGGVNFIFKVAA